MADDDCDSVKPPSLSVHLAEIGVRSGDSVLIVTSGNWSSELPWEIWTEVLTEIVGQTGTMIQPNFELGRLDCDTKLINDATISSHPRFPFSATGRNAEFVVRTKGFDYPLGGDGPITRLHKLNGIVLLIGCDHRSNPVPFLAFEWADMPYLSRSGELTREDGTLLKYRGAPGCTEGFTRLDPLLRQSRIQRELEIAGLLVKAFRIRPCVAMVQQLVTAKPEFLLCTNPACDDCNWCRNVCSEPLPLK